MRLIQRAISCFNDKLPFVLYAKPQETILNGFFQKNDVLHEFQEQSGFVFHGFYNDTNVVFPLTESFVFQEEINLENDVNGYEMNKKFDENAQSSFVNLVNNAIAEIENGTFKKVVLSRTITVSQTVDFIKSYQKLIQKYTGAFRYLWFHPKVGMWMGATPEQLVKIKNNTLETVALAGTQVFSEPVIWQEKELEEQQLVTDYIKSSIGYLVEALHVSETYTHQAGNLVHLKSDISGKLNFNVSEKEVIRKLHPTSAVCGMPLQEARDFIVENENYNRKYYAGFLGEFQIQDQTDLFVNLRCCEIGDKETKIYVGCGITKDSQPEKEFIETENKANTILSILVKN